MTFIDETLKIVPGKIFMWHYPSANIMLYTCNMVIDKRDIYASTMCIYKYKYLVPKFLSNIH